MMPPSCHVCGLDFRDLPDDQSLSSTFTLVHFALTPQERAAREAGDRDGWVGHPDNAVWFCRRHAALAEAREHMHVRDALASIAAAVRPGG